MSKNVCPRISLTAHVARPLQDNDYVHVVLNSAGCCSTATNEYERIGIAQ